MIILKILVIVCVIAGSIALGITIGKALSK